MPLWKLIPSPFNQSSDLTPLYTNDVMFRQRLLGHGELEGTHKRGINRVITVRHKLDLHCHCGLINVLSEGLRGVAALLSNGTDVVFSSPIKQQETEEIMYLTVLWGIKKTGA